MRSQGVHVFSIYDVDSLYPVFAPGTGEFMVGGFRSPEAMSLVRTIVQSVFATF